MEFIYNFCNLTFSFSADVRFAKARKLIAGMEDHETQAKTEETGSSDVVSQPKSPESELQFDRQ